MRPVIEKFQMSSEEMHYSMTVCLWHGTN